MKEKRINNNDILDIVILIAIIAMAVIGWKNNSEYEKIKQDQLELFKFQSLMMQHVDAQVRVLDMNVDEVHRRLDREKIR